MKIEDIKSSAAVAQTQYDMAFNEVRKMCETIRIMSRHTANLTNTVKVLRVEREKTNSRVKCLEEEVKRLTRRRDDLMNANSVVEKKKFELRKSLKHYGRLGEDCHQLNHHEVAHQQGNFNVTHGNNGQWTNTVGGHDANMVTPKMEFAVGQNQNASVPQQIDPRVAETMRNLNGAAFANVECGNNQFDDASSSQDNSGGGFMSVAVGGGPCDSGSMGPPPKRQRPSDAGQGFVGKTDPNGRGD